MIRARSVVAAAFAALLCTLVTSAPASAAAGLTTGFLDDQHFFGNPTTGATWLDRARQSNAHLVRINLLWSRAAPQRPPDAGAASDPNWAGYRWAETDAAVRAATAHGLRVMLTFSSAPGWAEGPNRPPKVTSNLPEGVWKPDPGALRAFANAAARRYSGTLPDATGMLLPHVSVWQVWNEPNLAIYLAPQWVRSHKRWKPFSPGWYRRMLNGAYAGVKAAQAKATIVSAGTAPYGDPPGRARIRPAEFTREFLCLRSRALRPLPCPQPARFDVIAHHPYSIGAPERHAINADDVGIPDLASLTRPVRKAVRSGRALPARHKPLWITEISWDSAPPDPQGVPIARHAQWLERSFHLLWRQGARVVLWLSVGDQRPLPSYDATYQSGIFFADGRPKPAATAFRFPFVSSCKRKRCSLWGRSPVAGTVVVERQSGSGWRTVTRLRAGANGIFTARLARRGPVTLRARTGNESSLSYRQR